MPEPDDQNFPVDLGGPKDDLEDQTEESHANLAQTDGVSGTDRQRSDAAKAVDRALDGIEKLEILCRCLDADAVRKVHGALFIKLENMRDHLLERANARTPFEL